MVVFGQVFSRVRGIPTGNVSYLAFMTPGILAQSVLFVAIFYGIAVIWERDLGIVHKLLVSPALRSALVYGKAASAGFRGAVQAIIIYVRRFRAAHPDALEARSRCWACCSEPCWARPSSPRFLSSSPAW